MARATGSRVPVLDSKDRILSYTHPARARKLVKSGKAFVIKDKPFIIKLARDPREEKMQKKYVPIITNFTEYFRVERDVYVQNRSNNQVSMQYSTGHGVVESLLLPKGKKPLNLTQLMAFDDIKRSTDLKKLVNRRPPVLVLMDEEEYIGFYQKLADLENKPIEQVMDEAHMYQSDLQNKLAFTKPMADPRKTIEEQTEEQNQLPPDPQDKLTARVAHLCANVGADVEEKDMLSEAEMLYELKDMNSDDSLTNGDFEFLLGKGYHPGVKKWAQDQLNIRIP